MYVLLIGHSGNHVRPAHDAPIGAASMDANPVTVGITDQQFSPLGTLTLFVSYDIAAGAIGPVDLGASIGAAADIASPDTITGSFPLNSGLASIPEPTS